jgi:hypothetical protein
MFLNLARAKNNEKKLYIITRDDGYPYNSDSERNEAIVEYFEKIYKSTEDNNRDFSGCIEAFLGTEISNSNIVLNSKLSGSEKLELDAPLTAAELDKSAEKCNPNSAPGADGISNTFIKKYWNLIRIPLLNYAVFCFEKNILTPNFSSVTIKLIPKKGNVELLKNWRPISLLSNLYKIISRAINNRLNKVVNRICSRAQKGFNNTRVSD